jgi:hypothetical protein
MRGLATKGLLGAIAIAALLALRTHAHGFGAIPDVLRTAVAGCVLFGLVGYPVATALIEGDLIAERPLLVLPIGAAVSSLTLTALGLLHVPLPVSLAVILAVAVAASARLLWRGRTKRSGRAAPEWRVRIGLPLALAAIVAAISLLPSFRAGAAAVPGQNGDAILVVGSAELLEHAPPTANRTDLPIPSIPLVWRSKYPIYYALAAVSTLAGQNPITAFPTVAALMLALAAIGFFLFARYLLRAPPWLALLMLFLAPLDRIVMYVTIHPYYNELWGQFALPYMLLFGWRFLTVPSRRSAVTFVLFALLGLFAYPLMLPFPALFLLVTGWIVWRRRRAAGEPVRWISALELPRPGPRSWLWAPLIVVAVPVVAVLGRGFVEKTSGALQVIAPWTNLAGWSGAALKFIPAPEFVGLPGPSVPEYAGVVVIGLLACLGLSRVRAVERWAVVAMVLGGTLIGFYFRLRTDGQLFYFKDLAFTGPYVVMLALLGLSGLALSTIRRRMALGIAGLAAAVFLVCASASQEVDITATQANEYVLQLSTWNRELPRGTSIRIDIPPSGWQVWAAYMFVDHPLSTLNPLGGIFPHPVLGRKADYVITLNPQPEPADATGAAVLRNFQFTLWRMKPSVPGPDVSSRQLQYDITSITIA